MILRRAQAADVKEIAGIYEELFDYEAVHGSTTNWRRGLYPTPKTAEKAIREGTMFVIEDGSIGGSAIFNHYQAPVYREIAWKFPAADQKVLVIHTLCVSPSKAGQGLGRALVRGAIAYARSLGCRVIRLDTWCENRPAASLYAGMGFRLAGSARVLHEGVLDEELIFMELDLGQAEPDSGKDEPDAISGQEMKPDSMDDHDPVRLMRAIQGDFQRILGSNLMGFFVHGSLTMGCFRWEKSDLDFLAVVREAPPLEEKAALIHALLDRTHEAPPKGIEMSVVLEEVCRNFRHPAPFELHFSNMHLDRARENPEQYCREMQGADPDLAAHFAMVRARGWSWSPVPADELFAPVPMDALLDSIRSDVAGADVQENPAYAVLNACRAVALAEEGLLLSKSEGARWALEHFPEEHWPVVSAALNAYERDEASPRSADADMLRRYALWRMNGQG